MASRDTPSLSMVAGANNDAQPLGSSPKRTHRVAIQNTDAGGDVNVGGRAAAAAPTVEPPATMPDASSGTSGAAVGSLPLAPRLAIAPQSTGQQLLDSQEAADWVRWLMAQESHQRQWAVDVAATLDAQRREIELLKAGIDGRHNEVATALAGGAAALQQHGTAVGAAAAALEARIGQRLGVVEAAHTALDTKVGFDLGVVEAAHTALDNKVVRYTDILEARLKAFEDELRGYTRDLEAKLGVLEHQAVTAAAAAAVASGAPHLHGRDALGSTTAGAQMAETQRLGQAIREVAQRTATEAATLAMQIGAVKHELEAKVTAVNDVIDAVSVAAQVQETATDAQLGRISVDAVALKSEVSRIQREMTSLSVGIAQGRPRGNPWVDVNVGDDVRGGVVPAPSVAGCSGPPGGNLSWAAAVGLEPRSYVPSMGAPRVEVIADELGGGARVPSNERTATVPSAGTAPAVASWRADQQANFGCACGGHRPCAGASRPDPWSAGDPWSAAPWQAGPGGAQQGMRRVDRWTVIFDQKEVRNVPSYNGKDKTEIWRAKMTNYLMSRAPEIARLLAWAEQQPQPIVTEALNSQPELQAMGMQGVLTVAPDIGSFHLWGVLNMNLEDKAWEIFEACRPMNGLEVWRRVLRNHVKKTPAEILDLETSASHPPKCRLHSEVDAAILKWEANVKKYHDSLPRGSPERLSEQKQVHALTRLLPTDIQEKVLWEASGLDTVHQLKEWATSKIRLSAHLHRGHHGGAKLAALVASLDDDDDDETRQEVENLTEASSEAEINAVMAKRGVRRAARGKRNSPQPSRPARDAVCPNCLEKGHTGAQCKKPRVENKDRKCFLCKEKGHRASECPTAKKGRGTNALTADTGSDEAVHQFCLASDEEPPVQRRLQAAGSQSGTHDPASCLSCGPAGWWSEQRCAGGAPQLEVTEPCGSDSSDLSHICSRPLSSRVSSSYHARVLVNSVSDPLDVSAEEQTRPGGEVVAQPMALPARPAESSGNVSTDSRGRWPTASQRTLGDFVHMNKFEAIAEKCEEPEKKNNEPNDQVDDDTLRTLERTTTKSCDEHEQIAAAWNVVEKRHKQRVRKKSSKAPQRRWAARVVVSRTPTRSNSGSKLSLPSPSARPRGNAEVPLDGTKVELTADEVGGRTCDVVDSADLSLPLPSARPRGNAEVSLGGTKSKVLFDMCADVYSCEDAPEFGPLGPAARAGKSCMAHVRSGTQGAKSYSEVAQVALLETHDDDLMNVVGEPEFIPFEVALDTGSVAHVLDKVDVPGYEPVESAGSKKKQVFTGAGGQSIANEGEVVLSLVAPIGQDESRNIRSTFQVAAVTRPLWSVSCILDTCPENSEAVFRRREAIIRDGGGKVIARFPRKGGLYVGTLMLRNPKHPGFRRQEQ